MEIRQGFDGKREEKEKEETENYQSFEPFC